MPREKKAPARLDARAAENSGFLFVLPHSSAEPDEADHDQENEDENNEPQPESTTYAHLSDCPELLKGFLTQANVTVTVTLAEAESETHPFYVGDIELDIKPLKEDRAEEANRLFTPIPKEAWIYVGQQELESRSLIYFEWPNMPVEKKPSKSKFVKKSKSRDGPTCVFRAFIVENVLRHDLWDGTDDTSFSRTSRFLFLSKTSSKLIIRSFYTFCSVSGKKAVPFGPKGLHAASFSSEAVRVSDRALLYASGWFTWFRDRWEPGCCECDASFPSYSDAR